MSTPSSARKHTDGYARIPNALIENQALFTHAEMALALIVLRRGGDLKPTTVSDGHWQSWTGLSTRAKEYAVTGLARKTHDKERPILLVEGRGDNARFGFASNHFEHFVRHHGKLAERPRTIGRSVDPKPGSKVHPLCREKGCALLAQENSGTPVEPGKLITLVPATPVAQRVAQTDVVHGGSKPVPEVSGIPEKVWTLTLKALQTIFPIIGVAFLLRLLTTVRAIFAGVTDQELAEAVTLAWAHKRKTQKSEGLFLFTVPDALAELRRTPKPREGPNYAERVRANLERAGDTLRARGAPFEKCAAEASKLLEFLDAGGDPQEFETRAELIEQMIFDAVNDSGIPPVVAEAARAAAARFIEPYRLRMTGSELAKIQESKYKHELYERLGLPRLTLYYLT